MSKSATVADLSIDVRGLYRLAAPSTPAEVVEAVSDGSARGDTFTHAQVETMIAAAADKKAAAKVAAERDKALAKISELTTAYDERVTALRAEFTKATAGALSVEEIQKMVQEAVAPLQTQIENYKAQLAAKPAFKMPARSVEHGRASAALADLDKALEAITPEQMIDYARGLVDITGVANAGDGILKDLKHAQAIVKWGQRFIKAMENHDGSANMPVAT